MILLMATTQQQAWKVGLDGRSSLLSEGRYKEWFWSGLSYSAQRWVRAEVSRDFVPDAPNTEYNSPEWESDQPYGWQEQAACKDADPAIFFPEDAAAFLKPSAPWRKFCSNCPVKQECNEFAEQTSPRMMGVYGGIYRSWDKTFLDVPHKTNGRKGRPPLNKLTEFPRTCYGKAKHTLTSHKDVTPFGGKCLQCIEDKKARKNASNSHVS